MPDDRNKPASIAPTPGDVRQAAQMQAGAAPTTTGHPTSPSPTGEPVKPADAAKPGAKPENLSVTIPGGRYAVPGAEGEFVNAHGERIDEKGKRLDV